VAQHAVLGRCTSVMLQFENNTEQHNKLLHVENNTMKPTRWCMVIAGVCHSGVRLWFRGALHCCGWQVQVYHALLQQHVGGSSQCTLPENLKSRVSSCAMPCNLDGDRAELLCSHLHASGSHEHPVNQAFDTLLGSRLFSTLMFASSTN
jgi:hypothetical protein